MRKQKKISYEPSKDYCRWEWEACKEEAKIFMAEHPSPDKTYTFSTYDYDFNEGKFEEKELHDVPLTDEQYEYLLTQELYSCWYNFNDLVYDNPPFAKLLMDSIGDGIFTPNVILFDEVYEDAKFIEGNQRPACGVIYKRKDEYGLLEETVEIKTNRAQEAIIYHSRYSDWGSRDWCWHRTQTEGIDVRKLRELFGGADDKEMIASIRERFHEATAFEDLIGYLKAHRVKMSEIVKSTNKKKKH